MTRLEKSKTKLSNAVIGNLDNQEKLTLLFQELINQLPTYHEQKEFYQHYEEMKKRRA